MLVLNLSTWRPSLVSASMTMVDAGITPFLLLLKHDFHDKNNAAILDVATGKFIALLLFRIFFNSA